MKKIASVILILAILLTAIPGAFADENEGGALEVPVGEEGLVCYVTGVPEDKQSELAAEIQSSFPEIKLDENVLTDAEKKTLNEDLSDPDCDSRLCWAASISNTLWETGWGENVQNPDTGESFSSEDDLMAYFISNFSDGSNKMEYGFEWFFDGVSRSIGRGPGWSAVKNDQSSKYALAPEYSADNLVTVTQITPEDGSINALEPLLKGIPVNISAEIVDYGEESGSGHALTATGVIVDPAAEGTEGYYRYILLADSDNSVEGQESIPAKDRPNIFTCYPLKVTGTGDGGYVWEIVGFSKDDYTDYTRLKTVYALAPYGSEEAEAAKETDPEATKDAVSTPDLVLEKVFTSLEEGENAETVTEFKPGDPVVLNFTSANASYVNCTDSFYALVTLKRESDGETVSFYAECQPGDYFECAATLTNSVDLKTLMPLSSGSYSVSVELNPKSAPDRIIEAYYLNNLTLTQFFKILGGNIPTFSTLYAVQLPILIPDNGGRYCSGSGEYGILALMSLNSFHRLEVKREGEEEWTVVDEKNYTLSETSGSSFRLNFADGYLESLGDGCHGFRFTMGDGVYRCEVEVCL